LTGKGEPLRSASTCEEPELPNPDEPARQDMGDIATEEFRGSQGHFSLLVAVRVILPAKGHAFAVEIKQAVIADCNPMGIAAQITEHLLGVSKGRLGVCNPILVSKLIEEVCERSRLLEN
jgi:hypothetical protein